MLGDETRRRGVPPDHRDQINELLADYRRSRENLASVQREMLAIAESATSPDGLITARAGARGTLTALTIAPDAYQRYQPQELAAAVLRTATEAAARVAERTSETLAAVLPSGADPAAVVSGTADLRPDELVPPQVSVSPARHRARDDADDEDSYEQQSWLHGNTGRGRSA
jgi:DNA-binding protein YbaB